jgi:hypothetical protein
MCILRLERRCWVVICESRGFKGTPGRKHLWLCHLGWEWKYLRRLIRPDIQDLMAQSFTAHRTRCSFYPRSGGTTSDTVTPQPVCQCRDKG